MRAWLFVLFFLRGKFWMGADGLRAVTASEEVIEGAQAGRAS
jgi:hypothetical protein